MILWPLINDITTTYPSAPQFIVLKETQKNRDYSYPEDFYKLQNSYYKLEPLLLDGQILEVFKKVLEVAKKQTDWEFISIDEINYRLEATATTSLLRFKDDVVVELRPIKKNRIAVHMRSKSRKGKGDLGANARRIQNFLSDLKMRAMVNGS